MLQLFLVVTIGGIRYWIYSTLDILCIGYTLRRFVEIGYVDIITFYYLIIEKFSCLIVTINKRLKDLLEYFDVF